MALSAFNKPIPGSSLTTHKMGERPWERPPELNSMEEVLPYYMKRLAKQEVLDDVMVALEAGIPLKPMVESLYTSQVMRGMHSLDLGLLVAPALTEFIAAVADDYGVEYKYTSKDPRETNKAKEKERIGVLLSAAIEKSKKPDEGTALLSEMLEYMEPDMAPPEEEMLPAPEVDAPEMSGPEAQAEMPAEPMPEELPPAEPAGRGLMTRM